MSNQISFEISFEELIRTTFQYILETWWIKVEGGYIRLSDTSGQDEKAKEILFRIKTLLPKQADEEMTVSQLLLDAEVRINEIRYLIG